MTPKSVRIVLCLSTIFVIAALTAGPLSARRGGEVRAERGYISALSTPRASVDPSGHIVISFEAKGDLRGNITIELDRDANGLAGKWAMAVAYTQNLNADGTPAVDAPAIHDESRGHGHEHHADPDNHREYVRLVNDGTLSGTVKSASLQYGPDGSITGVERLLLTVEAGSVKFETAKGYGEVVQSDVEGVAGTLNLVF